MNGFFSFRGRIRREQFFMHTVLSLFGALALLALIVSGLAIVEPIFGTVIAEFTTAMLLSVTVGVFSWINVATEVKRLHDLNRSGWH